MAAVFGIFFGSLARARIGSRRLGLTQLYSSAAGFGQPDCYRLLSGASAMLALPDVMNLFAHELACLGGCRLTFFRILTRPS